MPDREGALDITSTDGSQLQEDADFMTQWGDNIQSEASRLAERARAMEEDPLAVLGYEGLLALSAVCSLVEEWTEFRRGGGTLPQGPIPEALKPKGNGGRE